MGTEKYLFMKRICMFAGIIGIFSFTCVIFRGIARFEKSKSEKKKPDESGTADATTEPSDETGESNVTPAP